MATENVINYEAVLADLEAKKAKIEAMITVVKEFLGVGELGGTATGTASTSASLHTNADIAPNEFAHMAVSDAAEKYLKRVGQLKSTSDILSALQRGGFVSAAQDFRKTLSTILNQKSREHGSDIVKFQRKWGLASWSTSMRRVKNGILAGTPDLNESEVEEAEDASDLT